MLGLPVFVITPSDSGADRRDVHLGWVVEWDDASEAFLVTFTDEVTPASGTAVDSSSFKLLDDDVERRRVEVAARPNQQKFKFDVLARYGAACAVCDLNAREILDAVHIADKSKKGTDNAENGLVLCANHHRAFDRGLFWIDPATYSVHVKPHHGDLRLTRDSIAHLKAYPHADALEWRWARR